MVLLDGKAVATSDGFTVTVTEIGEPWQPAASGVIIYSAVPGKVAVNVCDMIVFIPGTAPVTLF